MAVADTARELLPHHLHDTGVIGTPVLIRLRLGMGRRWGASTGVVS